MDDQPTFSASYVIELGPEFPGNGVWDCRVVHFDADGNPGTEPSRGVGAPMYARVRGSSDEEWIASFDSSGLGRDRSVFRTPDPTRFLAVVEGRGYLLYADDPDAGADVVMDPVRQVVELVEPPLMLLVSWAEVVAIGPDGVRWTNASLVDDDLAIGDASSEGITCTGHLWGSDVGPIVLNPHTGSVIAGPVRPEPSTSGVWVSGRQPTEGEWTIVLAALAVAGLIAMLVLLASSPW